MAGRQLKIVVIGSGIAGLAASLAFAREGHRVLLIERDGAPPPATADESFLEWDRPGVPQRRLLHGFLPLARRLLLANLPDVVERLVAAGAHHVDQLAVVVNREDRPGDEQLFVLRSRRTVFEWVLRQVVDEEPGVSLRAGETVSGLLGDQLTTTGVRLRSGGRVESDLVVDASGRRSGVLGWLQQLGATLPREDTAPCGLVYFSRFYRHRDPDLPVAYRDNLEYSQVSAAAGDGNTFCLTFFARAEEHGLRLLRQEAAFERAVAAIEGLRPWRDRATPLGPVNAMGTLNNSIRRFVIDGRPVTSGLLLIGDTLTHTNPSLGRGMSLGLDHAFRAARIPWRDLPMTEGALDYHSQVDPMAEASYKDAVALESLNRRAYGGEAGAREEPRAVLQRAVRLAPAWDQDLFRANLRDVGLLQPPGWIESEPWISRARALLERNRDAPSKGPDLERMLAILEDRA